ncbi:hypothetical protein [Sulfitobacter sp. R18_1]|uniref:hypothetical protein n=1 Tax=Sulfitobacter sp. R18_1 TaxID=2821104 RepID=UPI001ADC70AD|nr:hypothetical protein [Sulfitobacter sp. R18_1]MBO9428104.1 hypothetical protein [Sulfitobacter sp. R18_1]
MSDKKPTRKLELNMDLVSFLDEEKRTIDDVLDRFGRHVKTRKMLQHHIEHEVITPRLRVNRTGLKAVQDSNQSRLLRRRKDIDGRILKLMKDGQWRNRKEIADGLKIDVRRIESDIPRLVKSGVLFKTGTEFRSASARSNRPSNRNKELYDLLTTPVLQRNVPKRIEGLEDPSHTHRLAQLEEQGLINCRVLYARSKDGTEMARDYKFWFQKKAAKKMEHLADHLEVDENDTFCFDKLPKRHVSPRTALAATKPEGETTECAPPPP